MDKITVAGVLRTCDKIESVLARKVIDLRSNFAEIDPKKHGVISDTKFFTVVYNQLGHEFGVCQEEVKELSDYFKKEDGRVSYQEFLQLVAPKIQDEKSFVTGLEWEDHAQINVLSPFEIRHLNLILTKIAYSCRLRGLCLEPYFKDYDRISGNNGSVTLAQFRRILYSVGITLGPEELQRVMMRYMKHNYTVNYVAFIGMIENIMKWFDEHGFLDDKKNFLENFPGRIIVADIDTLPRPEVGNVDIAEMFAINKACHPCVQQLQKNRDTKFEELMLRIKKHILDNAIRTREFFEKFDGLNRGFITKSQFHRGLDAIGLSGLHRLYVAPRDLEKIFIAYKDACDPDRVAWSRFCDDIDEVFTIKCLDKQPYRVVESPPEEVKLLSCAGAADWDAVPKSTKDVAQETVFRIRNIVKSQRMDIESFFKAFDKSTKFHVSRCQMRRILSAHSILLSETEVQALMKRYGDDMGFNYWKLLQEINETMFCEAKHQEIMRLLKIINDRPAAPCSKPLFSIIEVFAKVKGQITRKRINIDQFLSDGNRVKETMYPASKFRSSFSAAGIILDDCELDILCKSFEMPCHPGFVDLKSFCEMINQAFYRTKLEKQPCTVPIQHIPSPDDSFNFLNFNERCAVSHALQKLSRYHDGASNMKSFFVDRSSSGTVNKECLERVFNVCGGLMELITKGELDLVFKCFSLPDGHGRKFDYENFLMVLSRISAM